MGKKYYIIIYKKRKGGKKWQKIQKARNSTEYQHTQKLLMVKKLKLKSISEAIEATVKEKSNCQMRKTPKL